MSEKELIREIYDDNHRSQELIPLLIYLDGNQPIRLYRANVNPPGRTYKIAWTEKYQVVYWKTGKQSKWRATHDPIFTEREGFELVGTFDPSILLNEDNQASLA